MLIVTQTVLLTNMLISTENWILIENLQLLKRYTAEK